MQQKVNIPPLMSTIQKEFILKNVNRRHISVKKERIDKKVAHTKSNLYEMQLPNMYEWRSGQTLTPLMIGKIQW